MFTIKAGTSTANGDIIVDMGQVLRNLSGVEQDKEKKSLMQQILEPKEVDDSSRDTKKALQIAKKIARGESVTSQEKAFLMRVDPKLAQMAELAKQQGDRVKHALESASSKEEQQTIIMQAYQQVTEFTKANPQFGMLVGEAVKAAIQKAQKSASKESQPEQLATSLPAQAPQEAPTGGRQGFHRPCRPSVRHIPRARGRLSSPACKTESAGCLNGSVFPRRMGFYAKLPKLTLWGFRYFKSKFVRTAVSSYRQTILAKY